MPKTKYVLYKFYYQGLRTNVVDIVMFLLEKLVREMRNSVAKENDYVLSDLGRNFGRLRESSFLPKFYFFYIIEKILAE